MYWNVLADLQRTLHIKTIDSLKIAYCYVHRCFALKFASFRSLRGGFSYSQTIVKKTGQFPFTTERMTLPWSCMRLTTKYTIQISAKPSFKQFQSEQWWKENRNTFHELRNQCCKCRKCSSLLNAPLCSVLFLDFSSSQCVSSCKAGLLLFLLKCAGCMLDLIPQWRQWLTHGTPNPHSCACISKQSGSHFAYLISFVLRGRKGEGLYTCPEPESNQGK